MKIIVGLGNPGEEYSQTRHNAGFLALEALKTRITHNQITPLLPPKAGFAGQAIFKYQNRFKAEVAQLGEIMLVKPQTYMNNSGEAVQKMMQFYKVSLSDLWVIHDDLDIKLGDYKIQLGKGPKIHNGVNSVEKALGTSEFWRVRLGIDNRFRDDPNLKIKNETSGEKYVLGRFMEDEKAITAKTIRRAIDELIPRYL